MGHVESNTRDDLTVLGSATMNKVQYWCGLSTNGSPVVEVHNGKRFIIGWDEIILAAIEAGINEE